MPENSSEETKREKFVRLANSRYANACVTLQRLIPLADRNAYDYTDKDVEAIVTALHAETAKIGKAFADAIAGKTKKSEPAGIIKA